MTTSERTRDASHACDACGGTGRRAQRFDPVWPFKDTKACPVCFGSGRGPLDEAEITCTHESASTCDGAFCRWCGETIA